MKTSTKLLLVGLLILVASLATYNVALRAEYNRGEFRNPYRGYSALTLRNFDEVEVTPGSHLNVKIEAGPFAVWQHQKLDSVRVEQVGRRLRIVDLYKAGRRRNEEDVVVHCPHLAEVAVNMPVAGAAADVILWDEADQTASVAVEGFRQDSLLLTADQAATVELARNELKQLRVVAGTTPGSTAEVHIAKTNKINAARLNFQHNSAFTLDAPTISDLRYQFSDNVRATLPGAALRALVRE